MFLLYLDIISRYKGEKEGFFRIYLAIGRKFCVMSRLIIFLCLVWKGVQLATVYVYLYPRDLFRHLDVSKCINKEEVQFLKEYKMTQSFLYFATY